MSISLLLLPFLFPTGPAPVRQDATPAILNLRERARWIDRVTLARLEQLAPRLMREEGIDTWVLVAREYNEDPVVLSMLPATWMSARRRTILVLHDPGGDAPLERLAVARYDLGRLFEGVWDPARQPNQWAALAELLIQRDPARIALSFSPTFALADGLSETEGAALRAALPAVLVERIVSAERLAVRWLETRVDEELAVYPRLCRTAHGILEEGLSARVITPGQTTTDDLAWWLRTRVSDLGLRTWFHPSVSVQRASDGRGDDFSRSPGEERIQHGDLIHVDFGITYLRLNTDTQVHAYVLRPGETQPPAGLVAALAAGNRAQDLLLAEFARGRTGNRVLANALAAAREEGLQATIYTHPLGLHGHGAGPTIGLWDRQQGVPGPGDAPLMPHTCWAIELNVAVTVAEWGGSRIRVMLEEDAHFDGERVHWLDGRQTELLLVR
ncbi:MAG: M24 family metallopeptidase [Planctomycetota bacterium]